MRARSGPLSLVRGTVRAPCFDHLTSCSPGEVGWRHVGACWLKLVLLRLPQNNSSRTQLPPKSVCYIYKTVFINTFAYIKMKKLFELGAICIWWNIWQSHGSHGPCLHYPISVSSAPCSPAEPPHGGAFCPWGFSDRGQYVPKVRSRGKPHAHRFCNDYLITLFTLDLKEQRATKWCLLPICSAQNETRLTAQSGATECWKKYISNNSGRDHRNQGRQEGLRFTGERTVRKKNHQWDLSFLMHTFISGTNLYIFITKWNVYR